MANNIFVRGAIIASGGKPTSGLIVADKDGVVNEPVPDGTTNVNARVILADANGALASGTTRIGGANYSLVRYLRDGNLDPDFLHLSGTSANTLIDIQPHNGGYVLLGQYTAARNKFNRLNADGTIDMSWVPPATTQTMGAMGVRPDGRVIASTTGGSLFEIDEGTVTEILTITGSINSLLILPDGKILIGGSFSAIGGQDRYRLARLNADGTIDATWAGPVVNTTYSGNITRIYPADAGRFYCVHANGVVSLINADGSRAAWYTGVFAVPTRDTVVRSTDSAMCGIDQGSSATVTLRIVSITTGLAVLTIPFSGASQSSNPPKLLMQSDGKLVVIGSFDRYSITGQPGTFYVPGAIRINPDNTIDTSFMPPAMNPAVISGAALFPDDGMILFGTAAFYGKTSPTPGQALRLESGEFDDRFFSEVANVGVSGTPSVNAVAFTPDGMIYVAGLFNTVNSNPALGLPSHTARGLARLFSDGSVDTGFGDPGIKTTLSGVGSGTVQGIDIQPDGKIIAGGNFQHIHSLPTDRRVFRFNPDGSMDPSFEAALIQRAGVISNGINGLKLQPDGKVLVWGSFNEIEGAPQVALARLNADGSRDTGFQNPNFTFPASSFWLYGVAIQPDGKIIVGGQFTQVNAVTRNRLARLNADGTLDETFVPGHSGSNVVNSLDLLSDGRVVAVYNGGVWLFLPTGALDPTFTAAAMTGIRRNVVVDSEDRLLVSGTLVAGEYYGMVRLLPSGAIDATFVPRGFVPASGDIDITWSKIGPAQGLTLRQLSPANTAFIGREAEVRYGLIGGSPPIQTALTGNPNPGMEFDGAATVGGVPTEAGALTWKFSAADSESATADLTTRFRIVSLAPSEKILGLGYNGIYAFDSDGANPVLRASVTAPAPVAIAISAVKRLTDGKILIGGSFTAIGGTARHRVARLNPDGTLDATFPGPGSGDLPYPVRAIGVQSSGKIVVGCTKLDTYAAGASDCDATVARLNADGTLDGSFDYDDGDSQMTVIRALLVLPDDSLLVGGCAVTANRDNVGFSMVFKTSPDGVVDYGWLAPFYSAVWPGLVPGVDFDPFVQPSGPNMQMWRTSSGGGGSLSNGMQMAEGVWNLKLDRDGNVLVIGHMGDRAGATSSDPSRTYLDRIHIAGGFVTAFKYGGPAGLVNNWPTGWNMGAGIDAFEGSDGSIIVVGAFGFDELGCGMMRFGPNGGVVAPGPQLTPVPPIRHVYQMPDGRLIGSTTLAASTSDPRFFKDGSRDDSYSKPSSFNTSFAMLTDDDGAPPFLSDGMLNLMLEASEEGGDDPEPPDGETEEVQDGFLIGAALSSLPLYGLTDGLRVGAAPIDTLDGLARALDHIEFGDALGVILRELLNEGFEFGGDATENYRTIMIVADALRLAGVVGSQLEAVNAIAATFAFAELLAARDNQLLEDGLELGSAAANAARAGAQLVETLLLEADAGPAVVFAAVVRDGFDVGAGATTVLQAVEALREGVSFALHLTLDDGHYIAYSINTESKAVTQYANYPFNSFAKLGDRYYGMTPDGIRELEGPDDAGSPIAARFRMAMSNLGTGQMKRMVAAYLGYTSTGELRLKTITVQPDGVKRADHYRLLAQLAGSPREARIKIGQGLRSVYWGFEVESIDGAAFMIDVLDLQPIVVEQRIQGEGGSNR